MKKGYLLAAVVFAVVFCLVLVGCPKKQGMQGQGPGMKGPGMMMNGMGGQPAANAEPAVDENAEPAVEENAENAVEENAEPAADAEIPAADAPKSGG